MMAINISLDQLLEAVLSELRLQSVSQLEGQLYVFCTRPNITAPTKDEVYSIIGTRFEFHVWLNTAEGERLREFMLEFPGERSTRGPFEPAVSLRELRYYLTRERCSNTRIRVKLGSGTASHERRYLTGDGDDVGLLLNDRSEVVAFEF